jgi:hypothetical protein
MARLEIRLPFLAPVPVGQQIAIERYGDHRFVVVDLSTGIRWSGGEPWGVGSQSMPTVEPTSRSLHVVRACWVASNIWDHEVHTKVILEDAPAAEGAYR